MMDISKPSLREKCISSYATRTIIFPYTTVHRECCSTDTPFSFCDPHTVTFFIKYPANRKLSIPVNMRMATYVHHTDQLKYDKKNQKLSDVILTRTP